MEEAGAWDRGQAPLVPQLQVPSEDLLVASRAGDFLVARVAVYYTYKVSYSVYIVAGLII